MTGAMASLALKRFAWGTLAFNLAVILWGAYVRATGSGAGCGDHWPTCNGDVIPRDPSLKTLIEFTHRATSGVAFLLVLVLLVWTLRTVDRTHAARRAAWATMVFMVLEAAVGAGLVLFRLVADNESMARAMFMSVHLINTFLLLASMVLTAWWLQGGPALAHGVSGARLWGVVGTLLGSVLLGVSGAVAALGDTLYPARSLQEGLAADLSPTAHFLVRLRILHPGLAITVALVVVATVVLLTPAGDRLARNLGRGLLVLVTAQLLGGLVNVLLLAPVWMQLVHLAMADAVWLVLVVFCATVWAHPSSEVARATQQPALR